MNDNSVLLTEVERDQKTVVRVHCIGDKVDVRVWRRDVSTGGMWPTRAGIRVSAAVWQALLNRLQ